MSHDTTHPRRPPASRCTPVLALVLLCAAGPGRAATAFEYFDGTAPSTLPADWSAAPASAWSVTTAGTFTPVHSAPHQVASFAPNAIADKRLVSRAFVHPETATALRFWQTRDFGSGDGGVMEISINGGAWTDIVSAGGTFLRGGYGDTLLGFGNPLNGRPAWQAFSGWHETVVRLPDVVGSSIRVSWRLGSDSQAATGPTGSWRIDSIDRLIAYRITPTINGAGDTSPSGTQVADIVDGPTDFQLLPAPGHRVAGVRGSCGGAFAGPQVWRVPSRNTDCEMIVDFAKDVDFIVTGLGGDTGAGCAPIGPGDTETDCDTVHDALAAAEAAQTSAAVAGHYRIRFDDGLAGTVPLQRPLEIAFAFEKLILDGDTDGDGRSDIQLSGRDAHRVLEIDEPLADVELRHLEIAHGRASGRGGGGIYNRGTLTVRHSTITRNRVDQGTPTFAVGGGLYSEGIARIEDSTFSWNESATFGGAIAAHSASGPMPRSLTVDRSTVSNNTADYEGAAIYVFDVPAVVNHTTVSHNRIAVGAPNFRAAAVAGFTSSPLAFNASVVANTVSGNDCVVESNAPIAASHTVLESIGSQLGCGIVHASNGNSVGFDPGLAALADHGGATQTHMPQPGSLLIDAVACNLIGGFDNSHDQRGQVRPFDVPAVGSAPCDIGSVERQGARTLTLADVDGQGRVNSSPGGIANCDGAGGTCSAPFGDGTQVQLLADPDPHWHLVAWGGDCAADGKVVLGEDRSCTASFAIDLDPIAKTIAPSGAGTVDCDPDPVQFGTSATCTVANITDGYDFTGWGGDCTLSGEDCVVENTDGTPAVTANFALRTYAITAGAAPAVATVACEPAVATHGGSNTCGFSGVQPGYVFVGWGGDCTGQSGTVCTLTGNSGPRNVIANFMAGYAISTSVSPAGAAQLTCTPNPVPPNGTSVCSFADRDPSYVFAGWSGDCTHSNATCVLDGIDGPRSVQAGFVAPDKTLVVTTLDGGFGAGCVLDPDADSGVCETLHDAVALAHEAPSDDAIRFASGLAGTVALEDTVNFLGSDEHGANGSFAIDGDTDGDNRPDIALSGQGALQVVFLAGAQVELAHLEIIEGFGPTNALFPNATGAGIGVGGNSQLVLRDSVVRDNAADYGGGIGVQEFGQLHVVRSTIADNVGGAAGGGIHNDGSVRVERSVVRDNRADSGTGGGIHTVGSLVVEHSTISGNLATRAGGIFVESAWQAVVRYTTVARNDAMEASGLEVSCCGLALVASVLADNNGFDCVAPPGTVSANTTLVENQSGCGLVDGADGNIAGEDPDLAVLADNGGPTLSQMPEPGSVLIDAIACDADPAHATDQRDMGRGFDVPGHGDEGSGNLCDIGAVEARPFAPPGPAIFSDGFEAP